jgi:uncharacterized protein YecE (DUF72 family)
MSPVRPKIRIGTSAFKRQADFGYIRVLGDRKGFEQITKVWDKVVVDKQAELKKWAGEVESIQKRKIPVMIAGNNHFAGCAPETVRAFQKMLKLI